MFSFFRSTRRRSGVGVIEMGIVLEECVIPGRQSSLFKILMEINDFSLLHFQFFLLHSCVVVSYDS